MCQRSINVYYLYVCSSSLIKQLMAKNFSVPYSSSIYIGYNRNCILSLIKQLMADNVHFTVVLPPYIYIAKPKTLF